jgi:hypothetical protein
MRALLFVIAIAASACTSAADEQAKAERKARTAMAAESTVAASAAALPSSGKWDEPHLVERLVRAGLAPQARPAEKAEAFWKEPLLAYKVGYAMLHVYLYPDSLARRAVVATLDTLQIAPRGTTGVYAVPHILIVQNNLAAVLVGGSEAQQERVRLALEAGLPASSHR